jgi:hypothetical protein
MSLPYGPPETVPRYTMYPITLDVLALQLSATEWTDAEDDAVPDKATVEDELFALLLAVSDAVNDPEAAGANAIGTLTDFPVAIDRGNVVPFTVKTLSPVKFNCETVSVPAPTLVIRKFCVVVVFTATVPKANCAGENEICGVVELPRTVTVADPDFEASAVLVA